MAARETKPNGKSQLIRDLKNGEFATLYIISGEESYMKEYYLRQLRQKVVDETFADFNLIEFEGKGLTPEMLTEAIDSYPAMADKKLIIVKDFDLFKPPAGFADVLPSVLGDLPEYVCLVFYYDVLDGKPDKRTKLYKTLEKHACFAEFAHAEEQELVAWLERRAKALGCMIEPGDASYMIFLCGNSMTNLAGEMEKAAAHTTTGVIKRYNIDAVCSPVLDAVVFDLTDAVTAGRFDRAVALVGELLAQKNNEVMIFTAITRHIQRLYAAKLCAENRSGEKQLMEMIGSKSPYYARQIQNAARRVPLSWLRKAASLCAETDAALSLRYIYAEQCLNLSEYRYISVIYRTDDLPDRPDGNPDEGGTATAQSMTVRLMLMDGTYLPEQDIDLSLPDKKYRYALIDLSQLPGLGGELCELQLELSSSVGAEVSLGSVALFKSHSDAVLGSARLTAEVNGDPYIPLGDVNGDGATDIKDIVRLMKSISGGTVETTHTDINGDEVTDVRDIIRLMKMISES